MIKKSAFKKILVTTLAFFIVSILYLFPTSYKKNDINEEIVFKESEKSVIYIPDKNNYVSRTTIVTKEKDLIAKIKEIISYLTIDSQKQNYLPSFFSPIIPKNTQIFDISIENKLLKINFSKEFLNISPGKERKTIESLIYSLTEFEEIDKIMIFVEGKILDKIPNSSELIPNTLDRKMGINIVYDINSFKNTNLVTTYYIGKNNNYYYYIPISKLTNDNNEKIEIIIEQLKSMPIYETNLMSFLKSNVQLLDYEILENEIKLSFNNKLFDDIINKKILEEVKYSISLSINDNYNVKTVSYNVEDNEVLKFTLN